MKFKVGDKVKVIKCSIDGERCKNFNKISTITKIGEHLCYPYTLKDIREAFREDELELVEVQFTKSDLKDGDKCTLKNGQVVFVDKTSNYGFSSIDEQLRYFNDDVSIVKVERPAQYETVFEREEVLDETEKKYLTDVIRPFRKRIQFIQKKKEITEINPYIRIVCEDNDKLVFPYITDNSMYKGMESNRKYTLEELGL